ncbi:TPA: hypothetical protein SMO99_000465 [Proteus mirabilis]|uniref:hypothetical protein n=1 Tax=Proteus TaxID=583 RepID=UPI0010743D61|nr:MULTISPECIES: hypothetical protein [Proteus]EGT3586656.1 hypothetical protein [Proteus mirabilis]EHF3472196.1 hypothetical protein [Proteus mirabilis]MBG2946114.1 hypothetical protein [Proteus mirabilis]MBG3013105.1 hypothetical protein [Proteus mirabilis]MBG3107131.1 hypothetical protein [Proteus mirabilis]
MKNGLSQLTTLSSAGEKQLIRTAQVTAFISELLVSHSMTGSEVVSCEGMGALMECLSEQMESIIQESSLMTEEIKS